MAKPSASTFGGKVNKKDLKVLLHHDGFFAYTSGIVQINELTAPTG